MMILAFFEIPYGRYRKNLFSEPFQNCQGNAAAEENVNNKIEKQP